MHLVDGMGWGCVRRKAGCWATREKQGEKKRVVVGLRVARVMRLAR